MSPDVGQHATDPLQHPLSLDRVRSMTFRSSGVSGFGLLMISFGTRILPTS